MPKHARAFAALVLALAVASPLALAAGGSSTPEPSQPREEAPRDPIAEAAQHYNWGIKLRDKAWALEAKAANASEQQRPKLEVKIKKQYKKAIREFQHAVEKNPDLHQAFGSLGYGLRKLGRHEEALEAYDQALALAPDYAEAIEYRAEAYLGLNRVDEAKEAYIQLFGRSRKEADKLLEAMKAWLERHQQAPGEVDDAAVEAFAGWVEERSEIAGQTASLSELPLRKW